MTNTIIVTSMTGLVTKKIRNVLFFFFFFFCRGNNKYRMRLRVFTLGFTELIESVS